MTLDKIFKTSVQRYAQKPAIAGKWRWRTIFWRYSELGNFADGIAALLEKKGVKKGDRIILIGSNSPFWVGTFWGCVLKGAVVVPLNPQSTSEFIKKVKTATNAKIIFKTDELISLVELAGKKHTASYAEVDEDGIAEIVYTSGTTGDPKGVVLTHKNISSNLRALTSAIPVSSEDRFLSVLPLYHMFEQTAGMMTAIKSGSFIIYAPNLASRTIGDLMRRYRITKLPAVPEFLRAVMGRIEAAVPRKLFLIASKLPMSLRRLLFWPVHKKFGGKLKIVASGGAPLDPVLERKWRALGIELLQGYGLTETSPVISTNSSDNHRIGSVGKPLPGVQVRISDDGEILVKGDNVFSGYYKNPQRTKESFQDSWFKTADLGRLDEDGFLYIHGRKKYMILGPGGENVYPEDIERVLNKIPEVKDSAVMGLEKNGGPTIHAVLLIEKGDAEKIVEEANKHLAPYQRIQDWSVWPKQDFPRSATRKVKKEEVIKWLKSRKKEKQPSSALAATPLVKLLEEITGVAASQIDTKTKLVADLHLDSLLRIELVSRIEENFNSVVEESLITNKTTVGELEQMIKRGKGKAMEFKFKKWPRTNFAGGIREILQKLFLFPAIGIFSKLKIEGLENLKNLNSPAIFMSNHASNLDSPFILKAMPATIRSRVAIAAAADVVYKKYKKFAPLLELFFNAYPFPRKEGENIKSGLEITGKLLDKGHSILIYPEGQMSTTGELLPLKGGAGLLASEMLAPIVPVFIKGTFDLLPPKNKFLAKRFGNVTVKFGNPLKFDPQTPYPEATKKIEQAIKNLSTE